MKRRYELSKFDFAEADAIAEHLEAMAAKGWLLEVAGPHLWRYRKAEPQKRRYTVGYLPGIHSAVSSDPDVTEPFRQSYEAAGWQLVAEWFFAQIFTTEDPAAVAPGTDPAVKLEALRRSIGRQLWINVALAALFLALELFLAWRLRGSWIFYLSSNTQLLSPLLILAIILSLLVPFFRFRHWVRRAQSALEAGEACPPLRHNHRRFWNGVLCLVLIIYVAAFVIDALINPGGGWELLRLLFWAAGFLVLISLTGWLRRRGMSRDLFYLIYIPAFLLFFFAYKAIPTGTEVRQVSISELPLSAADLGFEPDGGTYCSLKISHSLLLRHVEARDSTCAESLFYDAYYPATDWVRGRCLEELEQHANWKTVADGVRIYSYQINEDDDFIEYLLETPDAIIVLYPPTPLDETQLATAMSHLAP